MRKKGLEPILDQETKVLIMGSLPSDKSISAGKYYANPMNDFWKLIDSALSEEVSLMDYSSRVATLRKHSIGLWDILKYASRKGSIDERIQNEKLNDFSILRKKSPKLKLIALNGKKAGEYEDVFKKAGYQTIILPSSSGANRRESEKRILAWQKIQHYL